MRLIGPAHSSQFMEQHNSGITTLKHAICAPNVFLKIAGKPNNYQFYLPNFLKFCDNISFNSIPGKISGNSGMVHFAEISQTPPSYSML